MKNWNSPFGPTPTKVGEYAAMMDLPTEQTFVDNPGSTKIRRWWHGDCWSECYFVDWPDDKREQRKQTRSQWNVWWAELPVEAVQ